MPTGLQVFDGQGRSILYNDRISRVIGFREISSDGSVAVPDFSTGTPWFSLSPLTAVSSYRHIDPIVTISGSTIQWSGFYGRSFMLIYGVY